MRYIRKMADTDARVRRMLWRLIRTGAVTSSAGHVDSVSRHLENAVAYRQRKSAVFREIATALVLPDGYDVDRWIQETSAAIGKGAVRNTEHLLSAAAIVIAHATSDDIYTEACSIASELDPGGWRQELNRDREIKLGELLDKGPDQIIAEQLAAFTKNLGNKSLPSRAELLFRHVPIRTNREIRNGESDFFTMDKLKEYDRVRHEIAHGLKIPEIERTYSAKAARFLIEAGLTALRSVVAAFNIHIDFQEAIREMHEE
jgi:hypothetical protein